MTRFFRAGRIAPKKRRIPVTGISPPVLGLSSFLLLLCSAAGFSRGWEHHHHRSPIPLRLRLGDHRAVPDSAAATTKRTGKPFTLPPPTTHPASPRTNRPRGVSERKLLLRTFASRDDDDTEERPSKATTGRSFETASRTGRRLLRRTAPAVSMAVAAVILRPAAALSATAAATTTITTIATCPVSAATELRLMIRLVVAALIGAALGKERAVSKHSAGVRTMSLVSLGAAVFTVCSGYGFANFPKVDASRMAANVASGVGFVGAGVITTSMREQKGSSGFPNNTVHGLTTAATIWLSAAVGVACGVGLLRVATTAALTTICILCMGRKTKNESPSLEYDDVEWKEEHPLLRDTDEGNPKTTNSENSSDMNGDDSDSEIHRSGHTVDGGSDLISHRSEIAEARPAIVVPEEAAAEIGGDRSNSTTMSDDLDDLDDDDDDVSSKLMEEILRSAFRYDNSTVAILVDRVLSQAEETGRFSERSVGSTRERRPPSSSDSDLLP